MLSTAFCFFFRFTCSANALLLYVLNSGHTLVILSARLRA